MLYPPMRLLCVCLETAAELYDTHGGDLDSIVEALGGAEKCEWLAAARASPPSDGIEWAERMVEFKLAGTYG
jgi:hypothetical protein